MRYQGWLSTSMRCSGNQIGRILLLLLLVGLLLVPAAALAEEEADESEEETEEETNTSMYGDFYREVPDEHFLGDYGRWIIHAQNTLLSMDLWGSSVTIPQGFMTLAFGYGTQRAAARFNQHRKMEDIVPVLDIEDPFHIGGNFFKFDFAVSGSSHGYFGALVYGITDNLMIGVSSMFVVVHIKLDAVFSPGSCERLGIATQSEFFRLLEKLGRPAPKLKYDSDPVDLGDTSVFLTWNYFRNKWFSGGLTGNLFLPTAHRADPNKNLIFALGPDLDTGNSAWGLGLSKVFDFRPPKPADIVTFSLGMEGAYFFQSKRESPEFLEPDQDAWDYLEAQNVDLAFFPDLSDMDDYYYYTPPPWVALSGTIGLSLFSVTYRHGWGFEGNYETNSPGFKKIIDEIGLVGTGDDGKLIFATSLPLTPLYIPGLVQFRFEYVTDGRNALIWRDAYQIGVGLFLPINPPERYRLGGAQ